MLTVAMVKARPAYDFHYVNRLVDAVHANLTIPHRIVCLTDDNAGVKCSTRQLPAGLAGWWAKMALFKREWDGPVLYLDLDTIIVGDLNFVSDYRGDFAILRDFYRPDGYGSGVMLWNKCPSHVWDIWSRDRRDHPLGDQGVMEDLVPGADRLQDVFPGKFVSYKVHCQERLPDDAAVVAFHGYPKPEDFPGDHLLSRIWRGYEVAHG